MTRPGLSTTPFKCLVFAIEDCLDIFLGLLPQRALNMRSTISLPVRSFCYRPSHDVAPSSPAIQAWLSAKARAAKPCRKSFSSQPWRLSQDPKSFTRYTLPKSINIEKASDMTTDKPKRARKAYIALGSNLGDRIAEIERACREMDARGIRVTRTSSLWETEPMYFANQDRFVNGVCEVSDLLKFCLFEVHGT